MFILSTSLSVKADSYDPSAHTLEAVEEILSGTNLSDQLIQYTDKAGNSLTFEVTYGEAILAAGAENNISPLELAAVIVEDTNGDFSQTTSSPLDIIYDKAEDLAGKNSDEVTYTSFKTTKKVN